MTTDLSEYDKVLKDLFYAGPLLDWPMAVDNGFTAVAKAEHDGRIRDMKEDFNRMTFEPMVTTPSGAVAPMTAQDWVGTYRWYLTTDTTEPPTRLSWGGATALAHALLKENDAVLKEVETTPYEATLTLCCCTLVKGLYDKDCKVHSAEWEMQNLSKYDGTDLASVKRKAHRLGKHGPMFSADFECSLCRGVVARMAAKDRRKKFEEKTSGKVRPLRPHRKRARARKRA